MRNAATPITAAGNAYGTLIQAFAVKWQAGHAGDLHSGLQKLDKQIGGYERFKDLFEAIVAYNE